MTKNYEKAAAKLDEMLREQADDGVVIVHAVNLKPEPVRWLWSGWLALGKMHIIAGAPGQGKTTILLAMAAIVTTGGYWPDGTKCPIGSVLIWSGEDDPADTLLPRLIAMGADITKVHFVGGTRVNGENLPFDPARDLVQLTAAAERIGDVKLLMVDPVVSAVGGDSHKNTEVRRALQPLVDLGQALQSAVVGVTHFTKGTAGQDPTERVVGSVAFGAVARLVMVAAKVKDEDGQTRRLLARAKSNIGPDEGGFEYAIEQIELDTHPGVHASRIVWGDSVEGTARELLAEAERNEDDDAAYAINDAVEFLKAELAAGPVPSTQVYKTAADNGHARRTLERAKATLKVRSKKTTMGWYWSLPATSPTSPTSSTQKGDDLGGEVVEQAEESTSPATSSPLEQGDVDDVGDVAPVASKPVKKAKKTKTAKVAKTATVKGDDVRGDVDPPANLASNIVTQKAGDVGGVGALALTYPRIAYYSGDPDELDFVGPPDLRRKARELVLEHARANDLSECALEGWMADAVADPRGVIASLGDA